MPRPSGHRLDLHITEECWQALEHARQSTPLAPYVEKLLRQSKQIKTAAKALGVEFRERTTKGRPKQS